ncbi:MAG: serine hydrolase [Acidimicrobiia bacterium]
MAGRRSRHEITPEHLLQMRSGLAWDQNTGADNPDIVPLLTASDAFAYAAGKELVSPPGTEFLYNTGGSTLIAGIIADEVGRGADFEGVHAQRAVRQTGDGGHRARIRRGGDVVRRHRLRRDHARLRPFRPPLSARRCMGRRAGPARRLGRLHQDPESHQPGVRRPLVARPAAPPGCCTPSGWTGRRSRSIRATTS